LYIPSEEKQIHGHWPRENLQPEIALDMESGGPDLDYDYRFWRAELSHIGLWFCFCRNSGGNSWWTGWFANTDVCLNQQPILTLKHTLFPGRD